MRVDGTYVLVDNVGLVSRVDRVAEMFAGWQLVGGIFGKSVCSFCIGDLMRTIEGRYCCLLFWSMYSFVMIVGLARKSAKFVTEYFEGKGT